MNEQANGTTFSPCQILDGFPDLISLEDVIDQTLAGTLALPPEPWANYLSASEADTAGEPLPLSAGACLRSPWEYAHYMAMSAWLTDYEPLDDSPLEQVRGWLEAFYHTCEAEVWSVARAIACTPTPNGAALFRQLGNWGYFAQQVELCQALVHRVEIDLAQELRNLLGYGFSQLGHYAAAIAHYDHCLSLSRDRGDFQRVLQTQLELGKLSLEWSHHRQAIAQLAPLVPQAKSLAHWEITADLLQNLGVACTFAGQEQRGLAYLKEAAALAETHGLTILQFSIWRHFARVYQWRGQPGSALPYLRRCLAEARYQNHVVIQADLLLGIGRNEFMQHNYPAAIAATQESLALYRAMQHPMGQLLALADSGVSLAYGMRDYIAALSCFEAASAIAQTMGEPLYLSILWAHRAYCHAAQKQTATAATAIQAALTELTRLEGDRLNTDTAVVYGCLAKVHWEQGQHGRAIALILRYLWLAPPWRTANGRLLWRETWRTLTRPFRWRSAP